MKLIGFILVAVGLGAFIYGSHKIDEYNSPAVQFSVALSSFGSNRAGSQYESDRQLFTICKFGGAGLAALGCVLVAVGFGTKRHTHAR